MLFVTIKRGVCISLLVNSETLFILFKTSCIIIKLEFNQPMVLFVPGMCFVHFFVVFCV